MIIPFYYKNSKIPYSFYNWRPDWIPVVYNLKKLENKGVKVRFFNLMNFDYKRRSDIIGIDHRIIPNLIGMYGHSKSSGNNLFISFIKKLKEKQKHIILFDNKDGTNLLYQYLPFVDKYLKKQLLKDSSLYMVNLYGERLFIDYYVKNNLISETSCSINTKKEINMKREKEIQIFSTNNQKISLSWNIALSNFFPYYSINQILHKFLKQQLHLYKRPSKNRILRLSANFGLNYSSDFISNQRKHILKILKEKFENSSNVSLGIIPKREYSFNLRNSKAIFSPFGWGEICYRDFETFISGAALIKPNVDHLNTWPNIYKKNKTYIPLPWNFMEMANKIAEVIHNDNLLIRIAKNGQELYKKLWSDTGREYFCNRFINIFENWN